MMKEKVEKLVAAARKGRDASYSPYSQQKVGAALQTKKGKIYSAGNIENCCYAMTVCAERAVLYRAIASGEKEFVALAITNGGDEMIYPCGVCRQVIWELAGNIKIVVFNNKNQKKVMTLSKLYPEPYKKKHEARLKRV